MNTSEDTIVVYGATWCPDCVRAKWVLNQHKVTYQWVDIAQDPAAAVYVEEVNKGLRRVPTIIFPDGSILVEPSNAELASKIKGS